MEGTNHSRVGDALPLIHQSISRGIHMSGLYGRVFTRTGFPGGKIRPGFTDYVRSLTSVMHAHHLAEDQLAFPLFKERLPEAPYDRLADEHLKMVPIVDEVRLKIERATDDPESPESLDRIDTLMNSLAEIWRPHIAVEESHFTPEKIDAVMSADEQAGLLARIGEVNQKHSGPDYLVVPFTLFNLPHKERAYMSDLLPPIVPQQLVPVAWKEKWQPMSPFLLV